MADEQRAITFSKLTLQGWRQFGAIDIDLHPSLTVLTGGNGAGKSTLLGLFSRHFGFNRPLLATPERDEASGAYRYVSGLFDWVKSKVRHSAPASATQVGEITYSNGTKAVAQVAPQAGVEYHVALNGQQAVEGFHVPSHRQLPIYRQVVNIPTQPMLPQQAYDFYYSELNAQFTGGHTGLSPTYRIKEALISMAVFGPGSEYVQRNNVVMAAFKGYVDTLRKLLPSDLGFLDISIRTPDVVIVTKSGDFLIDAASGGVMALIDLAWQIYMFSLRSNRKEFVVTIDEPENHLHPAMQRTLMGNLLKAFPSVQFIVATHSPFIVSGLKDARVYVLQYDKSDEGNDRSPTDHRTRYVRSLRLDSVSRAGTASQILRDVLGLSTTYPEWVQEGVDQVVNQYKGRVFDDALLVALRDDLERRGLGGMYPDALAAVAKP